MSVLEYFSRDGQEDYNNSMMALGSFKKLPTEKQWNKYAGENNYLGSISLKRLSNIGAWTLLYISARKKYIKSLKIEVD